VPADARERSAGRVERVLALRSFPGLALVEPAHLAVMAEVAEERFFAKGATVFSPGAPVRAMQLIRRGEVAVLREGVAMRRFGEGDIVGAIASLTRDPEGQHVVATVDTSTFEIDRDDFSDVLEESFSLLHAAMRGTLRGVLGCRKRLPKDAGFDAPILEETRPPVELGLVERVLFLRGLLTYGRARVEALAELAREMTPMRVPAGTELWAEGDASPHSLLVWSGVVACTTASGQRFRFGPDSAVGGIDSLAGEPRWYRAVAETDLVALRADVTHLVDVIEDNPDMGLDMLRSAARILSGLYERLDRLALDSRGG
jgi:CRP-like cAMP-binding protein